MSEFYEDYDVKTPMHNSIKGNDSIRLLQEEDYRRQIYSQHRYNLQDTWDNLVNLKTYITFFNTTIEKLTEEESSENNRHSFVSSNTSSTTVLGIEPFSDQDCRPHSAPSSPRSSLSSTFVTPKYTRRSEGGSESDSAVTSARSTQDRRLSSQKLAHWQVEGGITIVDVLSGKANLHRLNGEKAGAYKLRLQKRLAHLRYLEVKLQQNVEELAETVRIARDQLTEAENKRLAEQQWQSQNTDPQQQQQQQQQSQNTFDNDDQRDVNTGLPITTSSAAYNHSNMYLTLSQNQLQYPSHPTESSIMRVHPHSPETKLHTESDSLNTSQPQIPQDHRLKHTYDPNHLIQPNESISSDQLHAHSKNDLDIPSIWHETDNEEESDSRLADDLQKVTIVTQQKSQHQTPLNQSLRSPSSAAVTSTPAFSSMSSLQEELFGSAASEINQWQQQSASLKQEKKIQYQKQRQDASNQSLVVIGSSELNLALSRDSKLHEYNVEEMSANINRNFLGTPAGASESQSLTVEGTANVGSSSSRNNGNGNGICDMEAIVERNENELAKLSHNLDIALSNNRGPSSGKKAASASTEMPTSFEGLPLKSDMSPVDCTKTNFRPSTPKLPSTHKNYSNSTVKHVKRYWNDHHTTNSNSNAIPSNINTYMNTRAKHSTTTRTIPSRNAILLSQDLSNEKVSTDQSHADFSHDVGIKQSSKKLSPSNVNSSNRASTSSNEYSKGKITENGFPAAISNTRLNDSSSNRIQETSCFANSKSNGNRLSIDHNLPMPQNTSSFIPTDTSHLYQQTVNSSCDIKEVDPADAYQRHASLSTVSSVTIPVDENGVMPYDTSQIHKVIDRLERVAYTLESREFEFYTKNSYIFQKSPEELLVEIDNHVLEKLNSGVISAEKALRRLSRNKREESILTTNYTKSQHSLSNVSLVGDIQEGKTAPDRYFRSVNDHSNEVGKSTQELKHTDSMYAIKMPLNHDNNKMNLNSPENRPQQREQLCSSSRHKVDSSTEASRKQLRLSNGSSVVSSKNLNDNKNNVDKSRSSSHHSHLSTEFDTSQLIAQFHPSGIGPQPRSTRKLSNSSDNNKSYTGDYISSSNKGHTSVSTFSRSSSTPQQRSTGNVADNGYIISKSHELFEPIMSVEPTDMRKSQSAKNFIPPTLSLNSNIIDKSQSRFTGSSNIFEKQQQPLCVVTGSSRGRDRFFPINSISQDSFDPNNLGCNHEYDVEMQSGINRVDRLNKKLRRAQAYLLEAQQSERLNPSTGIAVNESGNSLGLIELTVVKASNLPQMKKITNSADAFVEIGLSTLDQNALIAQNHPAMLGLSSIAHKNHNGNSNCSAGADGKIRNDFGSTASFALDASIPQINEKVVTRTSVQWRNLFPEWNEFFSISPLTNLSQVLVFRLRDSSKLGASMDSMIGEAYLPLLRLADQYKHKLWIAVKPPAAESARRRTAVRIPENCAIQIEAQLFYSKTQLWRNKVKQYTDLLKLAMEQNSSKNNRSNEPSAMSSPTWTKSVKSAGGSISELSHENHPQNNSAPAQVRFKEDASASLGAPRANDTSKKSKITVRQIVGLREKRVIPINSSRSEGYEDLPSYHITLNRLEARSPEGDTSAINKGYNVRKR